MDKQIKYVLVVAGGQGLRMGVIFLNSLFLLQGNLCLCTRSKHSIAMIPLCDSYWCSRSHIKPIGMNYVKSTIFVYLIR